MSSVRTLYEHWNIWPKLICELKYWRNWALKKFTVKPVEIPESNGKQYNEEASYLKVVPSTKCWLDLQLCGLAKLCLVCLQTKIGWIRKLEVGMYWFHQPWPQFQCPKLAFLGKHHLFKPHFVSVFTAHMVYFCAFARSQILQKTLRN